MRVTSLRSVFVGAAIAVLSAVALGQDMQQQASNLAGEWEMVIPRSERFYRSGTLSIKVRGEQIEIVREFEDAEGVTERKLTYFADGRGELNFWVLSDGKTEIDRQSRSKWKKNKLQINWSQKSNGRSFEAEEIYRLSAEGDKLTHTINYLPTRRLPFQSPFGSVSELTFRRKK